MGDSIVPMFTFLKKLFGKSLLALPEKKTNPPEPWRADFRGPETGKFLPVQDLRYTASYLDGYLELRLLAPNLFAWTEAPDLPCADFSLDADIFFQNPVKTAQGTQGTACSAGFIFRMSDQSSFMYILVSDSGFVRLDSVFNGEPHPVVAWTECPWLDGRQDINLTLVVRGSRCTLLANGRFALEADNDTVERGLLAFAAQTYNDAKESLFILKALIVETRPLEVEVDFVRFARIVPADMDQRRRLIDTFMGMQEWVSALVQIRKVEEQEGLSARDLFLRAECLLRENMMEEAETALKACLAKEPGFDQAHEEYFNVLYLRGKYLELRETLEADSMRAGKSPRLQNLLGHARFNLGDWRGAAGSYTAAARLEPSMPIYELNAARAWEKTGEKSDAAGAWLAASVGFFGQGSFEDAEECLQHLRYLKYEPAALASLEGRIAYARGNMAEAETIFAKLVKKGNADAPSAYLYGLLLGAKGNRTEAIAAFRSAASLDEKTPVYQFRLAEALYLSGQDCTQALSLALDRNPGDGWTKNLAGLVAMEMKEYDRAAGHFFHAAQLLPGEADIAVNLADCLSRMGKLPEALSALAGFDTVPAANNTRGNILARAGKLEDAAVEYAKACSLSGAQSSNPELSAEYQTNLGACYIELERWFDAAEALRKSLELKGNDLRTLTLVGDVWSQTGEAPRAELSWKTALQLADAQKGADGDKAAILSRLADFYFSRGKYRQAEEIAGILEPLDKNKAALVLQAIHRATSSELHCGSCGRSWTAPLPVPAVPKSSLHGEPGDASPSGSCPLCGKVFCVRCRKDFLVDGRFTCPDCSLNLNLNDDAVRWVVWDGLRKA